MDITITATSGSKATVDVPEEVAKDLEDTYNALRELPVNRAASVDFADDKEARLFCRQGKQWASDRGLEFSRRGNVKENPTRVLFRIYKPRPKEEKTATPADTKKK